MVRRSAANLFSFLTYHLYLRKRKPEMTILSTVCTKLLSTNAHLGRRVAAHHFKVYICGSRNGIAILDSDKTLICLRNALHFIGSLIRKKGRSFFLKTNQIFLYEIMEEMASCINDSQWKIGAFLTNSYANPKKFRSRKKKINFGLNQQPDCVVILNPDRKSSVILEADRSQIPIASLVDSTIPWESYKRITYPIPANDPIQFVYLFRHSITKTVILERPRIPAMNRPAAQTTTWSTGRKSGGRRTYSSASSSSPKGGTKNTLFCGSLAMVFTTMAIIALVARYDVPGATELLKELGSALVGWLDLLVLSLGEMFRGGRSATLGGVDQEWTRSSAEETPTGGGPLLMEREDWDDLPPIGEIPPLSPERGMVGPSEPTQAGLPASDSRPSPTFGDPRDPAPTYKRVPAPTYNYPPDLGPLTKIEEKRLKSALEYEKSISKELHNIALENGENFLNETSEDLVEAALNWKNSMNPQKLHTVLNSLKFCKAQSKYYKKVENWVKMEKRIREGSPSND